MIYADEKTGILVQGATGSQGSFHIHLMNQYAKTIGSCGVVAGTSPGKGGQFVENVPIYNSVLEAVKNQPNIGATVIFVPANNCGDAIMEAANAGIPTIVTITEHVPVHDVMNAIEYAKSCGSKVIGPNGPGFLVPNKCKLGIIPHNLCLPGSIGVISRSGTLTYEVISELSRVGIGQSGIIGIGGDPVIGQTFSDVIDEMYDDGNTKGIILIGEVGGNLEIDGANHALSMDLPVVAYIAGVSAPKDKRMGHAGAIIDGGDSDAQSKIDKLRNIGIPVANRPFEIPTIIKSLI